LSESLETFGVRVALALARGLPPGAAPGVGRALGRIAFAAGVRRRVCLENLDRAFGPAAEAGAHERLGRRAYEHVGMSGLEFLRLPRAAPAALRARMDVKGEEYVRAALAGGRGAIIASGHFGNWEMMGACAAARGWPVTFVVQRLRNSAVDRIVQGIRTGAGIEVVERGMALRRVHASLAANRLVHFMCDQDARRRGVFVPLFGVPASTPKGAAQLALRLGVPFIPAFGWRQDLHGRHCAEFTAPIIAHATDEDTAVLELLTEFNLRLEAAVRRVPEQYWWAHRRWKTRPA
jgi:KDO2-lipid IV(A) lauroyltransferase